MKTNGTLMTYALRCVLALIFFFHYSESTAQSEFGTDNFVSAETSSQTILTTFLVNSNNLAVNTGKETFFAHPGFYGEMPDALNIGNENAGGENPVAKPANTYLRSLPSLLTGNYLVNFKPSLFIYPHNPRKEVGLNYFEPGQLKLYAYMLKKYAVAHHFDTAYAFLANMGVLSNKKRFFVINLKTMEVEESGLVSHGRGQGTSIYDRNYSNNPDSKCTSLGRYMVSSSYRGSFGLSYRIRGLDSSNSNAQKRSIVLHSMHSIPDMESYMPACVSEGCPAVSEKFFSSIRKFIDTRKSPMLLWIIDSNLETPEITEIAEEEVAVPVIKYPHTATTITTHIKKRAAVHKQGRKKK